MRSLKKSLAICGIAVFILSVGQVVSYGKTGLRPSDEEYVKECDLIVEGAIVAVDKTMLLAPQTLAAKFTIRPGRIFKGKSAEWKYLTIYQNVGGCIMGGEITKESRRQAQERYKKGANGLFFLKKGTDNNYYLHFEDFGFKTASEKNIKWLENLLNSAEAKNSPLLTKKKASNFALTIASGKYIYEAGEPITISVEIINNSVKDILIVTPQDGSEHRFRYPHCIFEVKNSKGELIPAGSACKTVSPLKRDGFYDLKSRQSLKLYPNGFRLDTLENLTPGTYSVTFYYSTDAEKEWQWHGNYFGDEGWKSRNKNDFWKQMTKELKEVKDMLKKVPQFRLISNTITIEIKEKENTILSSNLSFLSDVKEFQEFRFQMTETEIKEIAQKNSLVLEGNVQAGFLVRNRDGQTLTLSMSDGRCSGIQRLPRQPSLQELMKSIPKSDCFLPLAKQVLFETNRIMSAKAGEMVDDPPEIVSFNIIYLSDQAAEIFKEVYKKSRSAGKFYALIGLYLLKDREFKNLKTDFLKNEQEKVYCQYGCEASENNDVKQVLDTWLEGIPKGLWYTKIVIEKERYR